MRRAMIALLLILLGGLAAAAAPPAAAPAARPLLLAHYMPWYAAKPFAPQWGWHWTMGHFDPERSEGGRQPAASHYRPLIGLYDSGDPDVLECQVLQMKLAGIDGVIIDWYGPDEHLDYGLIHRNSLRLVAAVKKAGLRFAVCYEDQSVPQLISGKVVDAAGSIRHGQKVLRWLADHWFSDPAYVRLEGQPLLLVFGPQFYREEEWPQLLAGLPAPPKLFTLHHRRGPAAGAFDWPQPAPDRGLAALDTFYREAQGWPLAIPVAFPRFRDIYQEAGVRPSYGAIDDAGGKTYRATLERALRSHAPVVQLATWNDWGEGTMIEPSVELGYRDLEATQTLRRKLCDPAFRFTPADLRLPLELLRRRQQPGNSKGNPALEMAARQLEQGAPERARQTLAGSGAKP